MIDKRRNYLMVLDTETCNGIVDPTDPTKIDLSDSLVYDGGFSIIDTQGNVYEDGSFIIGDVFCGEKELMKSAYYASKIPAYWDDYKAKTRTMVSFKTFQRIIWQKIFQYDIKAVVAHNAQFDVNALNKTIRYLTASKERYFFPHRVEIWDSLMMARSTVCKMPSYIKFCNENGFMTKHKVPQVQATAEVLYRYMTKNPEYVESHTALEDVKIEREIVWYCYRQKKPMNKVLYGNKERVPLFPKAETATTVSVTVTTE